MHLVSSSAKKQMVETRRASFKNKCPVCQKDRENDFVKVQFWVMIIYFKGLLNFCFNIYYFIFNDLCYYNSI